METFTNRFTVAMTPDKSEVVLNFFQNIPVIPDDVTLSSTPLDQSPTVVPVINLVMTGQCAKSLVDVLSQMLSTEE